MRKILIFGLLTCALAGALFGQEKTFNWVRANDESVQLDPADYHTGRVYRPGNDGGNIHVDIAAKQPVTIALAWLDDWNAVLQHPETAGTIEYHCLQQHVVNTTYECHLGPDRPMVLLIHDERTPDRAILTGIGAVLTHGAKQFISPNSLHVQYYSWACVDNCNQPEFRWVRLVKEKYQLTATPKIYSLLTPERDHQPVNVRIKAPVPMTIAVLPSKFADQVYDNPETLPSALANTSCKQRGVQSLNFDCAFNLADGPQSLVVLPSSLTHVPHKKAEIELQAVKCWNNCETLGK